MQARHESLSKEQLNTQHRISLLELQQKRCGFIIIALDKLVLDSTECIDAVANLAQKAGGQVFQWKQKVKRLDAENETVMKSLKDNSRQCGVLYNTVLESLTTMKATAEQLKTQVEAADTEVPLLEAQKKDAIASRDFKAATRISQEIKTLSTSRQESQSKQDEILRELFMKEREVSTLQKEDARFKQEMIDKTEELKAEKEGQLRAFLQEVGDADDEDAQDARDYLQLEISKLTGQHPVTRAESLAAVAPSVSAPAPGSEAAPVSNFTSSPAQIASIAPPSQAELSPPQALLDLLEASSPEGEAPSLDLAMAVVGSDELLSMAEEGTAEAASVDTNLDDLLSLEIIDNCSTFSDLPSQVLETSSATSFLGGAMLDADDSPRLINHDDFGTLNIDSPQEDTLDDLLS